MAYSRPERRKLAVYSAKSFLAQTWPNKELIIFNATRNRLLLFPRLGVREIRLRQRSIGEMLNICLENSNGTWNTIWWDDCIYRADYLTTLMKEATPGALVLLRNKTIWDKGQNQAFATENSSIVCPLFPRCHPVGLGLDLSAQFEVVKHVHNDADLIVKVVRLLND